MSMQQYVQRVRDTAVAAGGGYVPYSQSLEPTATLIKMMPQTADGICQALCAKWIAEHANDRSLWNWLCVPGTTNVRQGMITNLMVNFNESVTDDKRSGAFNRTARASKGEKNLIRQDMITNRYLQMYGVIRRGMARGKMGRTHSYSNGNAMGNRMAADLDPDLWNGQNFYILISILGAGGGHALCAFVGRNDIAFFDPNFGEFYFETRAKFKAFMRNFWKTTGYKDDFNAYYLMDYGRRV